jgi:hypothetical protein
MFSPNAEPPSPVLSDKLETGELPAEDESQFQGEPTTKLIVLGHNTDCLTSPALLDSILAAPLQIEGGESTRIYSE